MERLRIFIFFLNYFSKMFHLYTHLVSFLKWVKDLLSSIAAKFLLNILIFVKIELKSVWKLVTVAKGVDAS